MAVCPTWPPSRSARGTASCCCLPSARLDGSRIAGDAAVSYLMSLVQIERPGPMALQSLRDVIKFYPLHMRWDLATKPALHMRLSRVESVPTRVLTVARIGAEGQVPCRTMHIA